CSIPRRPTPATPRSSRAWRKPSRCCVASAPRAKQPLRAVGPTDRGRVLCSGRRSFMAKKKLSHDQKRKQKLARRASRQREEQSSLAYTGNKFKTDALTPVFFTTESAIYEVSEMTEGQLLDRHVRAALEKLVLEMRAGPLPPFENRDKPALDESQYA